MVRRRVQDAFADVDCLLIPSMGMAPGPDAFAEGAGLGESDRVLDRAARFTGVSNLTGCPVVSLPCGFTGSGWPVALQVVAPPGRETRALAAASELECRLSLPPELVQPTWARQAWAETVP